MKKTLLVIIGIIISGSMLAQEGVKYKEFDLDNGLHVILHEDHSTPIAVVTVMYHVGSKNEDTAKTGFAHFFEHLLFEGTENIERGEFDKYVENSGGTLNANTSQDRTFYYELMPSNQIEMGLWLESERMLHARVEDIGIETQREVVKEEKRQRMDNQPYGSFMYHLFGNSFKDHPYRWPVIGSMAHIDAAVEADYVNFYNTFYTPENACLSIAGDFDPDSIEVLVRKYFNTIPTGKNLKVYRDFEKMEASAFYDSYNAELGGTKEDVVAKISKMNAEQLLDTYFKKNVKMEIPRPEMVEPPLGGEIVDTVYDNISLEAVFMSYRIAAQNTKDFYALEVLNRVLSGGNSSMFNRILVDDKQMGVQVGSFPYPLEDPGIVIAYGVVNEGVSAVELKDGMTDVIKMVQEEMISEKELQKVQNQIENDFYSKNASVAGVAESLSQYYMYFGDTELINTEIDKYLSVTREDVLRVAKKYFTNDNRVVMIYLPKPVEK
jgi:zinc protease